MDRRSVLVGAASLLAGCGSFGAVADDRVDETVTPAPVPSPEPTETDPRRRFAGEFCPQFDRRTDQSVCGHAQSPDSALRFTTDRAVAVLADSRLTRPLRTTLSWSLEGELAVFARSWYLLRETESGWTQVANPTRRESVVRIDDGERLHWLVDTVPHDTGDDTVSVVAPLDPGRYAFVVQTVGGQSRLHTECIALFDVVSWDG